MSLLLLFTGAGAAAAQPSEGWRGQFQSVVRRAGLTAAVVATLQPVLVERFIPAIGTPRELAYDLPWENAPASRIARRSVALLGQVSTWPAQQTPAVGPPADFDFFQRWQAPHIYRNNRARVVDLLGDVSANGWLRSQPEFDFFTRWQQPHIQRRKPYYENLGDTAVWSAQPPPVVQVVYPPIDLPWQNPLAAAKRSGELLGDVTPVLTPAPFVPVPGMRWQTPVATARRGLLTPFGQIIFAPPAAAADQYGIAGLETWYYPRPRTLLGQVTWAARVPDVSFTATPAELAHIRWQEPPARLKPLPRLQGFVAYAAEVPQTEYQDGWRNKWQEPPANLQARRALELLTGWDWPGYGYSFAAVVPTPTEIWWPRWQDPPKAPARSIALNDQTVWPPQVPTVADTFSIVDLQHLYSPATRSVNLLGQMSTWPAQVPPVVVVTYQEGWRQAFGAPVRTALPRLEGRITWSPRVPEREYQDGWRNLWQGPPALLAPRRATNLLEAWDWPGYGFSFAVVVATPSELWQPRWQDPTKRAPRSQGLLGQPVWPPQVPTAEAAAAQYGVWTQTDLYSPAKRSQSLLGQIATWSPRVPDREFQEGWRSQFQDPPRYLKPLPRLQGQISLTPQVPPTPVAPPTDWWGWQWPNPTLPARRSVSLLGNISYAVYPFAQVSVVYQEGWRSAFLQPQKVWQRPRQQGFVSFAGVQGLPVATPSALWMPSWQQWPRERLRSIYLRQSSWAGWDPQFIIQITPPTPLEGVTFTFGLKRGASATPGTKEGATMTGQRKTGGATLITRVKPRNS